MRPFGRTANPTHTTLRSQFSLSRFRLPRNTQYPSQTLLPLRQQSRRINTGHSKLHPQLSAVDPLTVLLALTLSVGAGYIANRSLTPGKPAIEEEAEPDHPEFTVTVEPLYPDMPTTTPPGRPGTLTASQEARLKEFWLATLEVFGVTHDSHAANISGTSTPTPAAAPEDKQKKKSRMSLFGKKNKDSDAADSADEDDKHGLNKEFKQALASQSPEALRQAFWSMVKHDDPDALLLRFLRARKWDVHNALVMLVATMHWRSEEMHVDDDIMYHGESGAVRASTRGTAGEQKEAADFLTQLRMGKSFLHGVDKEGRPMCTVRVRLHKAGEQTEKSLERFTVYTIETARMMLRTPVDTATIVFDMTGFSMANMDYTPVKFMIKCFEANYPESLGSVLVYKSPWVFQGIWKIIRGWLDPVVASKVHFCSNVEELSEFIPKSRIAKELGGDENWEYKYVEPVEGEDRHLADTASRGKLEGARKEMVSGYEKETVAWAKGQDDGAGRGKIRDQLRDNYWALDPLLRARSLYDRTGLLGRGGSLDFYPSAASMSSTQDDLD